MGLGIEVASITYLPKWGPSSEPSIRAARLADRSTLLQSICESLGMIAPTWVEDQREPVFESSMLWSTFYALCNAACGYSQSISVPPELELIRLAEGNVILIPIEIATPFKVEFDPPQWIGSSLSLCHKLQHLGQPNFDESAGFGWNVLMEGSMRSIEHCLPLKVSW